MINIELIFMSLIINHGFKVFLNGFYRIITITYFSETKECLNSVLGRDLYLDDTPFSHD